MQRAVTPGADLTSPSYSWLNVYGRLKPGITRLQAQADLLVLSQQLARSYPDSNKDIEALAYAATLVPGPFRGFLSMITAALMAVVGLVLLIACANAANLLLAQASGRSREMSVRSALGASRWRLLRQSLTESVLLGCFGGLAGLLLASMAAPLLLRLKPTNIPVSLQIPVDWRVLGLYPGRLGTDGRHLRTRARFARLAARSRFQPEGRYSEQRPEAVAPAQCTGYRTSGSLSGAADRRRTLPAESLERAID
jgi:hypothetical protein